MNKQTFLPHAKEPSSLPRGDEGSQGPQAPLAVPPIHVHPCRAPLGAWATPTHAVSTTFLWLALGSRGAASLPLALDVSDLFDFLAPLKWIVSQIPRPAPADQGQPGTRHPTHQLWEAPPGCDCSSPSHPGRELDKLRSSSPRHCSSTLQIFSKRFRE